MQHISAGHTDWVDATHCQQEAFSIEESRGAVWSVRTTLPRKKECREPVARFLGDISTVTGSKTLVMLSPVGSQMAHGIRDHPQEWKPAPGPVILLIFEFGHNLTDTKIQ